MQSGGPWQQPLFGAETALQSTRTIFRCIGRDGRFASFLGLPVISQSLLPISRTVSHTRTCTHAENSRLRAPRHLSAPVYRRFRAHLAPLVFGRRFRSFGSFA